jgi:hypothetical protein
MTAVSTFPTQNMEFLHPDDTMDLASSPYLGVHDNDDGLEPMRDTSVEPNALAKNVDPRNSTEDVQIIDEELFDDDDMLDDDTVTRQPTDLTDDLQMDADEHQPTHEDLDILYDDEDPTHIVDLADPDQGVTNHDEDPFLHEEELIDLPDDENSMERPSLNQENTYFPTTEIVDTNATNEETEDPVLTYQPEDLETAKGADLEKTEDDHTFQDKTLGHEEPTKDDYQNKNEDGEVNPILDKGEIPPPGATGPVHEIEDSVVRATEQVDKRLDSDSHSRITDEDTNGHRNEHAQESDTTRRGDETREQHQTLSLHTVKVNYQGNDICLFPPTERDDSEMFFLSDTTLAYQTLDKLLSACREVLAGSIGDDDELVLDVASLGLHISEVSLQDSFSLEFHFANKCAGLDLRNPDHNVTSPRGLSRTLPQRTA